MEHEVTHDISQKTSCLLVKGKPRVTKNLSEMKDLDKQCLRCPHMTNVFAWHYPYYILIGTCIDCLINPKVLITTPSDTVLIFCIFFFGKIRLENHIFAFLQHLNLGWIFGTSKIDLRPPPPPHIQTHTLTRTHAQTHANTRWLLLMTNLWRWICSWLLFVCPSCGYHHENMPI